MPVEWWELLLYDAAKEAGKNWKPSDPHDRLPVIAVIVTGLVLGFLWLAGVRP